MARRPAIRGDDSPLIASTIDTRARLSWLLRTLRLNGPDEQLRVGSGFAERVGVSTSRVSRWESGLEPVDARTLGRYEWGLDLVPGSLQGYAAILARTFRRPGPRIPELRSLEDVDTALGPVLDGDPRGIDWLRFARALATEPRIPSPLARPAIVRLVSELCRSVDGAYFPRAEAMSLLRRGPYGALTAEVVFAEVLAADHQVPADPLGALAETADVAIFDALLALLRGDSDLIFRAATYALGVMTWVGGLPADFLRSRVEDLTRTYDALSEDPMRHRGLSDLLRSMPPGVLRAVSAKVARPLVDERSPEETLRRDGSAWAAAEGVAAEVRASLPRGDDAQLDRVIFETAFDPRAPRRYLARMSLSFVPYREALTRALVSLAESDAHAASPVGHLAVPETLPRIRHWRDGSDQLLDAELVALGHQGPPLEIDEVRQLLLARPAASPRILYAAGHSGTPQLAQLALDPTMSADIRAAARWWAATGARVTDR